MSTSTTKIIGAIAAMALLATSTSAQIVAAPTAISTLQPIAATTTTATIQPTNVIQPTINNNIPNIPQPTNLIQPTAPQPPQPPTANVNPNTLISLPNIGLTQPNANFPPQPGAIGGINTNGIPTANGVAPTNVIAGPTGVSNPNNIIITEPTVAISLVEPILPSLDETFPIIQPGIECGTGTFEGFIQCHVAMFNTNGVGGNNNNNNNNVQEFCLDKNVFSCPELPESLQPAKNTDPNMMSITLFKPNLGMVCSKEQSQLCETESNGLLCFNPNQVHCTADGRLFDLNRNTYFNLNDDQPTPAELARLSPFGPSASSDQPPTPPTGPLAPTAVNGAIPPQPTPPTAPIAINGAIPPQPTAPQPNVAVPSRFLPQEVVPLQPIPNNNQPNAVDLASISFLNPNLVTPGTTNTVNSVVNSNALPTTIVNNNTPTIVHEAIITTAQPLV